MESENEKLIYYVARNGQVSGAYTEDDVRTYLAAGSLRPSDGIRAETSTEWTTIGRLFQIPQATADRAAQPRSTVSPAAGFVRQGGPVPPNLHWFLLLLLYLTWIFPFIWSFVQASFAHKIDRDNSAIFGFVVAFLFAIAGFGTALFNAMGRVQDVDKLFIDLMRLASAVAYLFGAFSVRRSMETYYTTVEPIRLRLSGVMTLFFGVLYLQYHMSRIARWKKTGVLTA
jgi:hypothetical protein